MYQEFQFVEIMKAPVHFAIPQKESAKDITKDHSLFKYL